MSESPIRNVAAPTREVEIPGAESADLRKRIHELSWEGDCGRRGANPAAA
jgi:hypothetical protein